MSAGVEWQAEIETRERGGRFRIGRCGDEVVAEWTGTAILRARRDGSEVRLDFAEGVHPATRTKIERGSSWLLVRSLRGGLSLHGAAIAFGDRAILLLGRSGQGKSTLAAEACRLGATFLADDAVGLDRDTDGWHVVSRDTDHWLDGATAATLGFTALGPEKWPYRVENNVGARSFRLGGIVDLRFKGDESRLVPATGMGAVGVLVPQVARFVLDEDERTRRELDTLLRLAEEVPVVALERPRDRDRLAETVALLRAAFG